MVRGERPIKLGNSWFSPKSIEVEPCVLPPEVKHWLGQGAYPPTNPSQTLNAGRNRRRRQPAGDNVRGREGNNPDRQPRSPNSAQWERMWERPDNQEVGLEAAILERKRNSSLVK